MTKLSKLLCFGIPLKKGDRNQQSVAESDITNSSDTDTAYSGCTHLEEKDEASKINDHMIDDTIPCVSCSPYQNQGSSSDVDNSPSSSTTRFVPKVRFRCVLSLNASNGC